MSVQYESRSLLETGDILNYVFSLNLYALTLPAPNLVEAGKLLRQNLLGIVDANRVLLSSIVMDRRESEILVACARGELYDDSFTAMHNA